MILRIIDKIIIPIGYFHEWCHVIVARALGLEAHIVDYQTAFLGEGEMWKQLLSTLAPTVPSAILIIALSYCFLNCNLFNKDVWAMLVLFSMGPLLACANDWLDIFASLLGNE